MLRNLWFIYNDSAICLPPKCGGTGLYRKAFPVPEEISDREVFSHVMKHATFMPRHVVGGFRLAVLGVRDPVERFKSLWRDKCRDGDENMPYLSGLSPTLLLEYIEGRMYADSHWAPQSHYYTPNAIVVPHATLLAWFGVRIVNMTEIREDDPSFPVSDILRLYAEDVKLIYK